MNRKSKLLFIPVALLMIGSGQTALAISSGAPEGSSGAPREGGSAPSATAARQTQDRAGFTSSLPARTCTRPDRKSTCVS